MATTVNGEDFIFSAEEVPIPYTVSLRGKYLQANAQRLNMHQVGVSVKGRVLVGKLNPDGINPISFSVIKADGKEERVFHSDLRALYIGRP